MPKEDFCYTYYDGDAARDQSHMNRLERGGYHDIIVSQRKFGHLSLSLIKKTLGNDFEAIWESIEIILKKDSEEKFYVEWVEESILRTQKFSEKQSGNGKKGGRPKTQIKAKLNPNKSQTISEKKPLEDVHVYEDDNVLSQERGTGENPDVFRPDKTLHHVDLPEDDFNNTVVYLENVCSHEFKNAEIKNQWLAPPEIERQWKAFKIQYFNGQSEYDTWIDVVQHFRDWLKQAIKKTHVTHGTKFNTNGGKERNIGAAQDAADVAEYLNQTG